MAIIRESREVKLPFHSVHDICILIAYDEYSFYKFQIIIQILSLCDHFSLGCPSFLNAAMRAEVLLSFLAKLKQSSLTDVMVTLTGPDNFIIQWLFKNNHRK